MQILLLVAAVWAGEAFERQVFTAGAGTKLPYRLLMPENYDPKKTYPMIVWLHGKGERGSDNEKQLSNGVEKLADPEMRSKYPAIVVVPQCPENEKWTTMSSASSAGQQTLSPFPTPFGRAGLELVASLQKRFNVDGKHTSLVGISMGAFATMDWLARKPEMFSSALALSGGGDTKTASTLAQARLWFIHGKADSIVKVDQTLKVVEAVRKAGGDPKLTVVEGRDHGPWDDLTTRPDVLKWLFDDQRPIMIASPKDAPTAETGQ